MDEWAAERVLTCVEQIPPGRVVSYGDIAGITDTTPRQVGSVLRVYGSGVTWWRVTNASGGLVPHLLDDARAHWFDEGMPTNSDSTAVRLSECRADLNALAAATDRALGKMSER